MEEKVTIVDKDVNPPGLMLKAFFVNAFMYTPSEAQFDLRSPFVIDTRSRFGISKDLKVLAYNLTLEVKIDDQDEAGILFIDAETFFNVTQVEQFRKDDKVDLPEDFLRIVANTAVGLTRGIILERTGVGRVPPILVPLLDMSTLLPNAPIGISAVEVVQPNSA